METIDYTEHLPEIIEQVETLQARMEGIKEELDETPKFIINEAPPEPIYKLKYLTELPSREFITDLLNSMRVHVHGETDVYENHPDMFEKP
jgi:hypothetical protein